MGPVKQTLPPWRWLLLTAGSGPADKPGRAALWGGLCILVGLSVAAFALTLRITGPELSWDGKDYAQLARQVARGEGYTTKVLEPEMIDAVERQGKLPGPWVNVFRPPLPVLAMALCFKTFGYSDLAAVLWSGGFYVLSTAVLFLACTPLFGYRAGFLAGLVFLVSRCGLVYARSGLTESAAIFFLLIVFWIVVTQRPGIQWALLAGTAMGACWLARPIASAWLLAAVPFVCWDPDRPTWTRAGRRLAAALAGFLLAVLVSQYALHWPSTNVLMSINVAYRVGPAEEVMKSIPHFVLTHIPGMLRKYLHEILRPTLYLFQLGGFELFFALIPFSLIQMGDVRQSRARAFLVTLFVVNAGALGFLTAGDAFVGPLRYFDVLAPMGLPWAAAFVLRWNGTLGGWRQPAFYVLLLVYLCGSAMQSVRDPFVKPVPRSMYEALSRSVNDAETIAVSADLDPPGVAWYSDRRALSVPSDRQQAVEAAEKKGARVNWFLRPDRDPVPPGFALARMFPGGIALYRRL